MEVEERCKKKNGENMVPGQKSQSITGLGKHKESFQNQADVGQVLSLSV